MTFLDKYYAATSWQEKVTIMEIYHLAMRNRHKDWTINKTAKDFGVSIGLVSENIRLAQAIHHDSSFMAIGRRADALRRI